MLCQCDATAQLTNEIKRKKISHCRGVRYAKYISPEKKATPVREDYLVQMCFKNIWLVNMKQAFQIRGQKADSPFDGDKANW